MRHWRMVLLVLVSAGLVGCSSTGQRYVSIPLLLAGTEQREPQPASDGARVTLTRAELAFGPLYLCAGTQAGELCDVARLEWLDSAVVDLLSANEVAVGDLRGVSGPVRSWMYDLGVSSLLTRAEPYVLKGAETLGGVSLVLEGLTDGDGSRPWVASVPLQQSGEAESGVPLVRKAATADFFHEVSGAETALVLKFDPGRLFEGVGISAAITDSPCPQAECGPVELTGTPARALALNAATNLRPAFEWR